jgi:TolB protein
MLRAASGCCVVLASLSACTAQVGGDAGRRTLEIVGNLEHFAPGIASTEFSDVRLTLSPDGRTALWFSRNRPGGPGGYDIWISELTQGRWSPAKPVSFNTPQRDFDPAFSADGRYVYFCSDRPGGLGGDDLYRVPVTSNGFGLAENLGPEVNSAGNEWAPMLSPDARWLLFSSNGRGGAGRFDLFTAKRSGTRSAFDPAVPLAGDINTAADEFDATFLADSTSIVFTRAPDLRVDKVRLFFASMHRGRYEPGTLLPDTVNTSDQDAYAPMLDWSRPDHITFTGRRAEANAGGVDVYIARYRLGGVALR